MGVAVSSSPEVALLLAASGGDPTRESVRRLMSGRLDWEALTRLAIESHATPGLWEVVSTFSDLPQEANRLHAQAVLNDFRRYHIRSLVARTVVELRSSGHEVLAIKGAALLVGAVAKPPRRTMSDIDLLVVGGSPEDAWHVCQAHGWSLVDATWTDDLYSGHHHLPPLLDPDGVSIGLEIHRALLPGVNRLGINVADMIARSRTVEVNGVTIRVPSREDLLLHACLHFAWANKLGRGAWRAFADVHAIIGDPDFSWDRFVPLAVSKRMRRCCYWTLRLASVAAGAPVPRPVLDRLNSSSGSLVDALLERHYLSGIGDPGEASDVAERAQRWLWFAALGERGISPEADEIWQEGSVAVPGEALAPVRPPRGAFRAAVATALHFARLAARG